MYAMFVLALKPREIMDAYHTIFRDVNEIYIIKENGLARLRRDPELPYFLRRAGGEP